MVDEEEGPKAKLMRRGIDVATLDAGKAARLAGMTDFSGIPRRRKVATTFKKELTQKPAGIPEVSPATNIKEVTAKLKETPVDVLIGPGGLQFVKKPGQKTKSKKDKLKEPHVKK
ncbi:MAG: hypothetical protein KAW41_03230 [Candidatus Diapherotrites archaeon]|nr:hypothetical protein [Candidatus Diapherotrites archaeon]